MLVTVSLLAECLQNTARDKDRAPGVGRPDRAVPRPGIPVEWNGDQGIHKEGETVPQL